MKHTFNVSPSIMSYQHNHVQRQEYAEKQIRAAIEMVQQTTGECVTIALANCNKVEVEGTPEGIEALKLTQAGNATWWPIIPHPKKEEPHAELEHPATAAEIDAAKSLA